MPKIDYGAAWAAAPRIRGADGAARLLGIKPTTLESRIKTLGLQRAHTRNHATPL